MKNTDRDNLIKRQEAKINFALGLFIAIFGLIIVIAHFFVESELEKITNLVAGLILTVIGGVMLLLNRKTSISKGE